MSVPSTIEAQKKGIVKALDPQENAFRLEIDEFVQNKPMLNLFLLALEALQDNSALKLGPNPSEEDWEKYWWSWYSIAGIHGLPKEKWSHKHVGPDTSGSGFYCQHGKTLFPSWHRPYVLMMEQAVFNQMYAIANRFPENGGKAEYLEAAKRFRFPYWDPWMPRRKADTQNDWNGLFGVPSIFRAQEVFVRRPEMPLQPQQMDNPLYRYVVPDTKNLRPEAQIPWEIFEGAMPNVCNQITIRTPGSEKTIRNNEIILDYELRSQVVEEHSKLLQMLLNLSDTKQEWDTFSNHKATQQPGQISLESWHDNFHVLVGKGRGKVAGNMNFTQVAGFDPIFWLHHCNIDRILALFQALHPDRYVSADDMKIPLAPFFNGPGDKDLWTSKEARDWKQCGFAVPGTKDKDPKELQKIVGDYINKTYLWMSSKQAPPSPFPFPKSMDRVEALIGQSGRKPPPDFNIAAVSAKTSSLVTRTISLAKGAETVSERPAIAAKQIASRDDSAFPAGALQGNRQRTWNIHLKVRKFAFNGSFSINAFLGDVNDNSSEGYLLLDNQIGFSGVFTSSQEAQCDNCDKQRNADTRYADAIPLTTYLVGCLKTNDWAAGPPQHLRVLDSLEPKDVVPFLTKRLEWRITTTDDVPKSEQEVRDSGLEILVMNRWYNYPTEDQPLGSYEEATPHPEITQGKAGGVTS